MFCTPVFHISDASLQWLLLRGEEMSSKHPVLIVLCFLATSCAQIQHEEVFLSPRGEDRNGHGRERLVTRRRIVQNFTGMVEMLHRIENFCLQRTNKRVWSQVIEERS